MVTNDGELHQPSSTASSASFKADVGAAEASTASASVSGRRGMRKGPMQPRALTSVFMAVFVAGLASSTAPCGASPWEEIDDRGGSDAGTLSFYGLGLSTPEEAFPNPPPFPYPPPSPR